MFNPKVSIIIPVYNGSNYLAEAIDSALSQTYKNTEILVINDGSTDNGATEKIVLPYKDKIKYFYKRNGGVASALNLGIEKMTGEYFSWLSHDDLYYLNKIEKQINFLNTLENKKSIISSDFDIIDGNGKHINTININYDSDELLYKLFNDSFINGCSLLIPKECFFNIGSFNESLKTTQDYDMWFRLIKKYKFVHLSNSLIKSRSHELQDTKKLKDLCIKEQEELKKQILKYYSIDELKKSGKSKLPSAIFKLKILLLTPNRINNITKVLTKLGIYKITSKVWRKFFLKKSK